MPESIRCSIPGCWQPIRLPYGIANRPERFCSRACMDLAYDTIITKKKPLSSLEGIVPHVPAEDFGNAGVTRRYCDRQGCKKRITLCWRSRSGREYCSNECKKLSEQQGEPIDMSTGNTAATMATEEEAPITTGKPTTKKPKKSAAAKKTPSKKKKATAKKKTVVSENGAVRSGSNMEIVLKLLQRAKGATVDEIAAETGWEREMAARTMNNLKRRGIEISKDEKNRYTAAK